MFWCTLAGVPHAYNSASQCSGVLVNALADFLYLTCSRQHEAGGASSALHAYVVHWNWLLVLPVPRMVHSTSHVLHVSAENGLPWTWYQSNQVPNVGAPVCTAFALFQKLLAFFTVYILYTIPPCTRCWSRACIYVFEGCWKKFSIKAASLVLLL